MLSRLVFQRAPARAFMPNVSAAVALRLAHVARQQLATRTFLTTAHVSDPVAKDSKNTDAKPKAKKTGTKKAATKKEAGKSPRIKAKQQESDDPEARFNTPLKSLKLKKEELPPKRSPTEYTLFVCEQYVGAPKDMSKDFGERSREVSARWKQLSDEEKQPYVEKAKVLRDEYHQRLSDWFNNSDPRIVRAVNAQRKGANKKRIHPPAGVESSKPSPPLPPYIQFSMDIQDQIEKPADLSQREYIAIRGKLLADKWRALSEQERQRYADNYVEARKEYERKLQQSGTQSG